MTSNFTNQEEKELFKSYSILENINRDRIGFPVTQVFINSDWKLLVQCECLNRRQYDSHNVGASNIYHTISGALIHLC